MGHCKKSSLMNFCVENLAWDSSQPHSHFPPKLCRIFGMDSSQPLLICHLNLSSLSLSLSRHVTCQLSVAQPSINFSTNRIYIGRVGILADWYMHVYRVGKLKKKSCKKTLQKCPLYLYIFQDNVLFILNLCSYSNDTGKCPTFFFFFFLKNRALMVGDRESAKSKGNGEIFSWGSSVCKQSAWFLISPTW